MIQFLAKKGIMSKVFFYPVHLSTFYNKNQNTRNSSLKKTELVSSTILSLPMFPGLKLEEMKYIIDSIGEFFEVSK